VITPAPALWGAPTIYEPPEGASDMACHHDHEHGEHNPEGTEPEGCCGERETGENSCCDSPGEDADPAAVDLHA
jgi:hypothetical protein